MTSTNSIDIFKMYLSSVYLNIILPSIPMYTSFHKVFKTKKTTWISCSCVQPIRFTLLIL